MPDVIADLDRDERRREAEITPEMIEAGMDEFYGHPIAADEPTIDEVREAIVATFRAMALACRRGPTEV